ncbi:MAG TPA: ABC transporter ATP-binding protein [Jiangellales bacterium]|nr:ABC transporter ATP-binding protein [Jiangellales bacterium]
MADEPEPIVCRGLTRHYGRTIGIEDLDLVVRRGRITGFLGPNGAGKTTVLRLLVGLLRPTRGEAWIGGVPVGQPEARRTIGFMPADPAFVGELTGAANLDLLADLAGAAPTDRSWAIELLDFDARDLERPVKEYSSGMVQKLALIQAVQHRPAVVLLDEPANRLDPLAHHGFEDLVRSIAADGRTVLLSSHVLSEVESTCDEVAMVRSGRLLMVSSVRELSAAALRRVTILYRDRPAEPPDGLHDPLVDGLIVTGRIEAHRPGVLRDILRDPAVDDLLVEPAPLEETFVHLYREERGT